MKTLTNVSPESIELFESEGYENRILNESELERRLEAYGNLIEYDVNTGKNMVMDEDYNFTIDTTGWTLFDLLDYLNY